MKKEDNLNINQSWNNYTEKMRKLNSEIVKVHKSLGSCKKFETFLRLRDELSRLLRHKEVVENLLSEYCSDRERAKLIKHAPSTTK